MPTCQGTQELCGDTCRDLTSEDAHCGECGNACTDGKKCVNSNCEYVCDDEAAPDKCETGCYNFKTSVTNCGSCGTQCDADEVCHDGTCGPQCDANEVWCPGALKCADLTTDDANCGSCGTQCDSAAGESCLSEACQKQCPQDTEECPGMDQCIPLKTDESCGTCENHRACDADKGEVCRDRECINPCEVEGERWCAYLGICVDYQSNVNACGGCGEDFACGPDELCMRGGCVDKNACTGVVCGDVCVEDPQTDPLYCGADQACATYEVCGAGTVCDGGTCACDGGDPEASLCLTQDGFICTDPQTDVNHCGCTDGGRGGEAAGEAAGIDCAALPHVAQGGVACGAGLCVISRCADGWADCDKDPSNGCEINLDAPETCGSSCGDYKECRDANALEGTAQCVAEEEGAARKCHFTCKEGMATLDEKCVDTTSDPNHCGYVGHNCKEMHADATCENGFCQVPASACDYGFVTLYPDSKDGSIDAFCVDSADTLRKVRTSINAGHPHPDALGNPSNAYILVGDINIDETNWTPIGTATNQFKNGSFYGNGFKIKATISAAANTNSIGLFGQIDHVLLDGFNCEISITGPSPTTLSHVGGLVGYATNSTINNSFNKGDVAGNTHVGILVGYSNITNYAHDHTVGSVSGRLRVGGLAGSPHNGTIDTCWTDARVTGNPTQDDTQKDSMGVLTGWTSNSTYKNCWATGSIDLSQSQVHRAGGLIGSASNIKVYNSHTSADVIQGANSGAGGFIAWYESNPSYIENSYATGSVTCKGTLWCGGFIGYAGIGLSNEAHNPKGQYPLPDNEIKNCHATGNVTHTGNSGYVGGFAGFTLATTLTDVYATGRVTSDSGSTGGLVGYADRSVITSSDSGATYATGEVISTRGSGIGGLAGTLQNSTVSKAWASGNVTGEMDTGGLVGGFRSSRLEKSFAFGQVHFVGDTAASTNRWFGGLVGASTDGVRWIRNSGATGNVSAATEVGGAIGLESRGKSEITRVYGAGSAVGDDFFGAFLGRYNDAGSGTQEDLTMSLSIDLGLYNFDGSNRGISAKSKGSFTLYSFKFNEQKEAVLRSNANTTLTKSLGDNWKSMTCTLAKGPANLPAGDYIIPIPKEISPNICK